MGIMSRIMNESLHGGSVLLWESCHAYEPVMSYTLEESYLIRMNESCHIPMNEYSHTYESVMFRTLNESCHIHINEYSHTYE